MKRVLSIVAVALFVVGMTGCCCMKSGKCHKGCVKPCCAAQPADKAAM